MSKKINFNQPNKILISGSKGGNKVVGYCSYHLHKGFLNKQLIKEHNCLNKGGKVCPHLIKNTEHKFWDESLQDGVVLKYLNLLYQQYANYKMINSKDYEAKKRIRDPKFIDDYLKKYQSKPYTYKSKIAGSLKWLSRKLDKLANKIENKNKKRKGENE